MTGLWLVSYLVLWGLMVVVCLWFTNLIWRYMMISVPQRLQCLPVLFGGIAGGLLLALITGITNGTEPAAIVLLAALPFLLATLTGVAKTTTA
jgi:hypothetical protein